jgi:hypothetical protein
MLRFERAPTLFRKYQVPQLCKSQERQFLAFVFWMLCLCVHSVLRLGWRTKEKGPVMGPFLLYLAAWQRPPIFARDWIIFWPLALLHRCNVGVSAVSLHRCNVGVSAVSLHRCNVGVSAVSLHRCNVGVSAVSLHRCNIEVGAASLHRCNIEVGVCMLTRRYASSIDPCRATLFAHRNCERETDSRSCVRRAVRPGK